MADTVIVNSGVTTYLDIDSSGLAVPILVTDQGSGVYAVTVYGAVATSIPGGVDQLDFSQASNSQYVLLIF